MTRLFLFAILSASDDATQLLKDGLGAHQTVGYVVAGLAACLFLLPIVLKAMGKEIPFLDPIIEGAVQLLKNLLKSAPAPTPEELKAKADATAAEPGVTSVTNVVELKPPEKK